MSQTQIEATALLCRMLESAAKEISGLLLSDPGNQDALAQLRREHLVVFGERLNWLQCPECRDDMARVVRELPGDKVLLLCGGDCEDFEAPRSVCQTSVVKHRTCGRASCCWVGSEPASDRVPGSRPGLAHGSDRGAAPKAGHLVFRAPPQPGHHSSKAVDPFERPPRRSQCTHLDQQSGATARQFSACAA